MAFIPINSGPKGSLDAPPPKRISTPAGMRLSVIMENSNNTNPKQKRGSWASFGKSPLAVKEAPRSSTDGSSQGYTYSIFAEKGEQRKGVRGCNYFSRKGGWKRLALFIGLFFITLIALIAGVVLGIRKHSSNSNDGGSSQTAAGDTASPTSGSSASGTNAASPATTSLSKDFPIGTYSFVSFLDTVQTDCASNANTWTCFPYTTIYQSGGAKAMTTFNWKITAGSKKNTYQISSTENPFAITFDEEPLTMMDQGLDSERYHFQITMDKQVVPTVALTNDNSASICFFNHTTFTGYLYTKRAKDYPTASQQASASIAYSLWPFAVRAEQTIGGGQDVPNCYKTDNGNLGERITGNITSADPSTLCSCLYKNWSPPK